MKIQTAFRRLVLSGVLMFGVLAPQRARAGGVVGNGDPHTCTESALDAALAGGGSVTFDCGQRAFTLVVTAPKSIDAETSLDGGGLMTLSGGKKVPIFFVDIGGTLHLSNTTLTQGWFSFGGAIYNDVGGTLTIDRCTFSRNRAPGPGDGGAIDNYGTLAVTNSTFVRNQTDGVSGAIENNGTMTVSNSTFVRNHAIVGGAIASAGPLTITNSTFVRNTTFLPGSGGAIYSAGDTIVQNSIFAYSRRGKNCAGPIIDGGHNLRWPSSDTTCAGTYGNPRFASLTNNGGGTPTVRLRPGSAAIDAGDSAICAASPVGNLDQRGFVRPGAGAINCSIGAYEFSAAPAP